MRFWAILRFEGGYQARRFSTWLFFAVLLVVAFLMTRDGSLAEALQDDFYVNAPFSIAKNVVLGSLIWLLIAASVAGQAAARDVATGMYPLLYTTPVGKAAYLGGRFLAAFVLNAVLLLAVPLGIFLAVHLPGVQPEAIGPSRPAAYLGAYFFIALPNAFAATAVQFWLAARRGRPAAAYLGSVVLFLLSWIVAGVVYTPLGQPALGRMLDALGAINIVTELSLQWTPAEKSTRLIALTGSLLWNRLVWIGLGGGALLLTYLRFRLAHRAEGQRWGRRRRGRVAPAARPADLGVSARPPLALPPRARTFGWATQLRQVLAVAGMSFRAVVKRWGSLAVVLVLLGMAVLVGLGQMDFSGVPVQATTARVLSLLTAPLADEMTPWMLIPLLLIFYAGELVWQERDGGLGEITGALPTSEWVPLLGKLLGLVGVLLLWLALLMGAGILIQVLSGDAAIDVGVYLKVLFGLQLPEYLLFAVLALGVHVWVDQQYIGHLVAVMLYVFIAMPSLFGVEHNLLVYGAGPGWSYSDMRGFVGLVPWGWFKLYWAAWAVLLLVGARLLWVRGRERSIRTRLQAARHRFTRPTAWVAAGAAALVLALGGLIFYNTNVLNPYRTAAEAKAQRAAYEKRYGRYAAQPQPEVAATDLHVEIYPAQRMVEIQGTYRVVNHHAVALDTLHLATAPNVATQIRAFSQPAAAVVSDEEQRHHVYALAQPLEPGDTLRLDFEVRFVPRGFRERGIQTAVVGNGTALAGSDWLPTFGYQPRRELTSARDRRAHGLPPRPLIPSLYDEAARMARRGAGAAFEAVVGTAAGQVALAPGTLRRTWTDGDRRYFHYATEAPIGDVAFFSADYEVLEGAWGAVAIQVFHHPTHTANPERMLQSARASLAYYSEQFGPYLYRTLKLVENPSRHMGAHAEPGLIDYGEGFALLDPAANPQGLDLPFTVIAHEVAHQWTFPYAYVEGAPVMSESLAQYGAMQVVKAALGPDHLQRLLRFMRQPYPYPPIRRGEPLLRAVDPYLAYRKGPFVLYALSAYLGEAPVNTALRRLIETHRAGTPPLATTLDLYRELQAVTPDSLQALLHDLFEVNTFWELEATHVTAKETDAGTWQVTLGVQARKVVMDSAGVEAEVPMQDWVEIGVFGAAEAGTDELSQPLYVQQHRVRSGTQTITVTVPRRPVLAGIDPYHLLDWEERADDDNIEPVAIQR